MTSSGPSLLGFIVGLSAAVAAFLATQGIAHIRDGIRFRRLLTADITLIAQAHFDHLPEIKRLQDLAAKLMPHLRDGSATEDRLPPIWDSDYSALSALLNNSQHLSLAMVKQCMTFYDSVSRLNECRKTYNQSVQQLSTTSSQVALGHLVNAMGCLRFMERYYRDVVRRGAELAVQLADKYWFLEVDAGRLADISKRVAE